MLRRVPITMVMLLVVVLLWHALLMEVLLLLMMRRLPHWTQWCHGCMSMMAFLGKSRWGAVCVGNSSRVYWPGSIYAGSLFFTVSTPDVYILLPSSANNTSHNSLLCTHEYAHENYEWGKDGVSMMSGCEDTDAGSALPAQNVRPGTCLNAWQISHPTTWIPSLVLLCCHIVVPQNNTGTIEIWGK